MYMDDDGEFYPLGVTLMNLLMWWWKDNAKARAQLKYCVDTGVDYVRLFSSVNWGPDASVDPRWPNYDANFIDCVETIYNEYGLRVHLGVFAGADSWFNNDKNAFVAHMHRICALVKPRSHMFLDFEIVNEGSVTFESDALPADKGKDILRTLTQIAVAESGLTFIGVTSDVPGEPDDRMKPLQVVQTIGWGATEAIAQMARTPSDGGWYEVSQPASDWKRYPQPVHHNEDVGPGASSVTEYDPIKLTTLRATSIMFGGGAWLLHNGAGISGIATPGNANHPPVPANLWETQNIDAIMRGVRGLDRFLPSRATDGRYVDMRLRGAMIGCTAYTKGAPDGAYRAWLCVQDQNWWAIVAGIRGSVSFTPLRSGTMTAYDILNGPVGSLTFAAGQGFSAAPTARDSAGLGTLIIRGTFTDASPIADVPVGVNAWGAWFNDVKTRHGLSVLNQESCEIYDAEISLLGGEGQKDSAGNYRGRCYAPSGNPADLYGKYFDMGTMGGALAFVPRVL
jgi:hypothetical protein